ncbi:MAG: GGDEF domain-containing protein [Treponema sp.]|jgi:diguanylate cyclase (GGDEF)-like protein|nr:GGDEF domain-containing protein [Treponema sp.]
MQLSIAINSILGSCFVLGLIFADYIRKHNTDPFQRRLFLALVILIFIAIVCDFFFFAFEGVPGGTIHVLMIAVLTVYYIFQVAAYYFIFIFIDYLVYNDKARTKKVLYIVKSITALHLIILILNYRFHFYFSISQDNFFIREELYAIRLIVSYFPAVFFIYEFIAAPRKFYRIHIYLICFFVVITGAGAAIDIILNSGSLIWPCLSSALLYSYFFIIRTDSKIDALTGIGNRYAFNEFITNLSRQTAKQSYSIVMIDMDRFKAINDTLGHLEGDNALRDMAAIIKGSLRSNDFAARYGGDEFVVAARADSDINRIMERIQSAISSQNSKNLRPYKIEISYGIGVFTTKCDQSIEAFLAYIDSQMYKHKAERCRRRHTDSLVSDEKKV